LETSRGFFTIPATQQEIIFNLREKGIKILSRKAQLLKSLIPMMNTVKHFSCHKNPR